MSITCSSVGLTWAERCAPSESLFDYRIGDSIAYTFPPFKAIQGHQLLHKSKLQCFATLQCKPRDPIFIRLGIGYQRVTDRRKYGIAMDNTALALHSQCGSAVKTIDIQLAEMIYWLTLCRRLAWARPIGRTPVRSLARQLWQRSCSCIFCTIVDCRIRSTTNIPYRGVYKRCTWTVNQIE